MVEGLWANERLGTPCLKHSSPARIRGARVGIGGPVRRSGFHELLGDLDRDAEPQESSSEREWHRAANHAQPSASPPITSVNQWTSSSTRLAATATAIPTARPVTRARASRERRRARRSAAAA